MATNYEFETPAGGRRSFATEGEAVQEATFTSLKEYCPVSIYASDGRLVSIIDERPM